MKRYGIYSIFLFVFILTAALITASCNHSADNGASTKNKSARGEISAQDFEAAFAFGKAFLDDYYSHKAGNSSIDLPKYIKNANLLKYSEKRLSSETRMLDIEKISVGLLQAEFIALKNCFYINYSVITTDSNNGGFTEPVELLISYGGGQMSISDWYIRHGSGSSGFDEAYRKNATIDLPDIWDNEAFVNSIFERAGIN